MSELQDALSALPEGGGTVRVPAGTHVINAPLNLRGRRHVRLIGEGSASVLTFKVGADLAGKPLIDMVGAQRCELSHLQVLAHGEHRPSVGLLLGRERQDGPSAGLHRFEDLTIAAQCGVANVAAYGSEVNTWTHCAFSNTFPGGGNYVTGRRNHEELASPFGAVAGGSNVDTTFVNCVWGVYGRTGTEVNIRVHPQTGWFLVRGGCMSNKTADRTRKDAGGLAGIRIGGALTDGACQQVVLDGLQAETFGARHCLEVTGLTIGLRVQNCMMQALESSIHVGGQLEDSVITQNTLDAGLALYDWSPGRRGLVTVGATSTGNVYDLRWARLCRLARDYKGDVGGRAAHALTGTGDRKLGWYYNELHVQRAEDVLVDPAVASRGNRVCAQREEH